MQGKQSIRVHIIITIWAKGSNQQSNNEHAKYMIKLNHPCML